MSFAFRPCKYFRARASQRAPGKPATNASPKLLLDQEKRYDANLAIIECLKNTRVIDTETMEEKPVPELLDIYEQKFRRQWFTED